MKIIGFAISTIIKALIKKSILAFFTFAVGIINLEPETGNKKLPVKGPVTRIINSTTIASMS